MSKVFSTATKGGKTKFIDEFGTQNIIEKYKDETNIDVSRFFTGLSKIKLLECEITGYRFYYPECIIADASFYEELATKRKNYYSRRWEHVEALKFIEKNDKVLEVGSGFGSFLTLLKENGIKDISGLELSNLAVEKCIELQLDVKPKLIEELNTEIKYDVICSFQVLEHIYDVASFLDSTINLLKPGGKLIIGVPNNNPYLHIVDKYHTLNLPPHHAGLWSKKSLRNLSKSYSLKVSKIKAEPLINSYSYFLQCYLRNTKNLITRKSLSLMSRYFPNFTKNTLSYFLSGRNVMVVYTKK
jgi:SAM-dependent methyltransferase